MRMYDIIFKKRNGEELSTEEINYFVQNYVNGTIPDYQVSALLMAIYFQKMNQRETSDLTMAMVNSGKVFDLSGIDGIKIDKHSTGGVGDKTTLVLAPMIAALGIPVVKMSGRGLGHTGGTIDKLESIKGFTAEMSNEKLIDNVNRIKIVVGAQTADIVPADKKLYALRDVTATIDNLSLIASSVMSKKIASGADCIVLDVKVGDGAFMKTVDSANKLAKEMVYLGNNLERKTVAIISDMDQPLGYAIGNSLEVIESIITLKGKGPKDLLELCLTLGSHIVVLAKKAESIDEARKMLLETIENGSALNKFKEFVAAQGGDASCIDNAELFPRAKYVFPVLCPQDGYVSKIYTRSMGITAMELGAGRATKESKIDPAVGIVINKKRGDSVAQYDALAYVYSNNESLGEKAVKDVLEHFVISATYDGKIPLIYNVIE